jgi:glycosyltransferase involved in cell wall biosynthesis
MMRTPGSEQPSARIGFFLPDLEMGGAERVFLTVSSALVRRGHHVELILARKSGPLLADVDPAVALVDLDAYRQGEPVWRFGIRTISRLARHLRRYPPDALFSTLTGANLSAIAARAIARGRFRLIIREAATLANVKSKARLLLMRLLYPLADRIIVLTDFMREQMHTRLGMPADKMVVIGNPVDTAKLQRLAQDPGLIKRACEFQPYAVCVGRLSEQKDQATAIKAIARVAASPRALNLVLVGDGPLQGELQAVTRDLGIENRVHFIGLQANPYPWIRQAEVFVLSSRWEGYPNVLLEATSIGVPIVATSYDVSVHGVLGNTRNTRIVNVGDCEGMAAAIVSLAGVLHTETTGDDGQLAKIVVAYENLLAS